MPNCWIVELPIFSTFTKHTAMEWFLQLTWDSRTAGSVGNGVIMSIPHSGFIRTDTHFYGTKWKSIIYFEQLIKAMIRIAEIQKQQRQMNERMIDLRAKRMWQ
jgi:hypothetical protein